MIKILSWLLTGKAEEYIKAGKGKKQKVRYAHNTWDDETHTGKSVIKEEVLVLDAEEMKDVIYLMPCPNHLMVVMLTQQVNI